jgi:hypothetical protein
MTVEITQSQERGDFLGETGKSGIFIYHLRITGFIVGLFKNRLVPTDYRPFQVFRESFSKTEVLKQPLAIKLIQFFSKTSSPDRKSAPAGFWNRFKYRRIVIVPKNCLRDNSRPIFTKGFQKINGVL